MGNTYVKCKYCDAVVNHGTICSHCYKKLKLVRKLQAMVRYAKEQSERSKHNESTD